jgi:hypothetical protein
MSKPMAFAVDRSRTIISSLIHGRRVSSLDVAWLRREVFGEGEVTREAAEELFAVARSGVEKAPDWTEFFVEMITEHVVWQSRPTGIVSDEQAAWLIEQADGAASVDALAVLVNVLAEAHRAPHWFVEAARARAARGWPGVAEALLAAAGTVPAFG